MLRSVRDGNFLVALLYLRISSLTTSFSVRSCAGNGIIWASFALFPRCCFPNSCTLQVVDRTGGKISELVIKQEYSISILLPSSYIFWEENQFRFQFWLRIQFKILFLDYQCIGLAIQFDRPCYQRIAQFLDSGK